MFTAIDPTMPVIINLRAANTFHAAFIQAQCGSNIVAENPKPKNQQGIFTFLLQKRWGNG